MLSPQSVASYLSTGHTVAQAAKRFRISERHVSRLKAAAAAPPSVVPRPAVRRYVPRPADELARSGSLWRDLHGDYQRPPIGTTGQQWNALQLHGVPLPICQVTAAPAVSDVPDIDLLFEALQSPISDVSSPDIDLPTMSDPLPVLAEVPPAAPVPCLHKDEAPVSDELAPVVLPRLRASSIMLDLAGWLWEHRPVLQLVVGLFVIALLVALGMP